MYVYDWSLLTQQTDNSDKNASPRFVCFFFLYIARIPRNSNNLLLTL